MSHEGWGEALPRPEAKRVGPFWVNKPRLETTLKSEFTFGDRTVRVLIEPTVDAALADEVVPLIVGRKVRFENDAVRGEFERLALSKPASIGKSFSNNGYNLRYEEPTIKWVAFRFEKGEVEIISVASVFN